MQHVVVTAEPVYDRLLGRGLVADDPVGLLVLRDGLRLRGACNALGEIAPSRTCTEVESSGLRSMSQERVRVVMPRT